MSATAAQIARIRRMVSEPTADIYTDQDLAGYIEARPCIDERGEAPFLWDTITTPPTKKANPYWTPTYDLNAAAADLWNEKAAIAAAWFDFSADGAQFSRSQAYTQAANMARFYWSRRNPTTLTVRPEPRYPLEDIDAQP